MADDQKPVDIQAASTPKVASTSPESASKIAASESAPAAAPVETAKAPEQTPPASSSSTPAMPSIPQVGGIEASLIPDLTPKTNAPEKQAGEDKNSASPEGDTNVFTELFGQDTAMKEEGMVKAVMGQQDKSQKGFFGKKPGLEDPKKPSRSDNIKRKPGKAVLQGAIAVLILVAGFFYTQNASNFTWFGANIAQKTLQAEEQAAEIQGEIHVQNHLAAILLLDKYVTLADEYFYDLAQSESEYVSSNKRADYAEAADALRPELLSLIADVQDRLQEDPEGEEMQYAKAAADNFIAQLQDKEGDVDEDTLRQEIHDFETAKKLMQSQSYKDIITSIDTNDATDEALRAVFDQYSEVNASISSIIARVKDHRIFWSQVIDQMEAVIKDVDPLFNTEFTGNLNIDTIKYDREQVDLTGQSVTDDSKNFTLISNLIDALEAEDIFSNVEERSFSKSTSGEDSYTGSFRLDMILNLGNNE